MCSDAKCVRRVIEHPFTASPPAVVPWCSFSHLWRCMGDHCLSFRKSDNGHWTMTCSHFCLTGSEMHPKRTAGELVHSSRRWDCNCSSSTFYNWFATELKHIRSLISENNISARKIYGYGSNSVVKIVLCSFKWPARAKMRLYLSFQKGICIFMPHLLNWDTVSLSHCTVTTPVKS